MCCLLLQPKLAAGLAKPPSLASDTSLWELTALLFNLIVPSALLFIFETKVLAYRGTQVAAFAFAKAISILHLASADTRPALVGCFRSKKGAGCVQHDPSSAWR